MLIQDLVGPGRAHDREGRDVHEALHALLTGCTQNIGRPLNVGLVKILAPPPEAEHPGRVYDPFAIRQRPLHRIAVPDIAQDQLHAKVAQKVSVGRRAHHGPNRKTTFDQIGAEIPPQETCRSSHEDHNITSLKHPPMSSRSRFPPTCARVTDRDQRAAIDCTLGTSKVKLRSIGDSSHVILNNPRRCAAHSEMTATAISGNAENPVLDRQAP